MLGGNTLKPKGDGVKRTRIGTPIYENLSILKPERVEIKNTSIPTSKYELRGLQNRRLLREWCEWFS